MLDLLESASVLPLLLPNQRFTLRIVRQRDILMPLCPHTHTLSPDGLHACALVTMAG